MIEDDPFGADADDGTVFRDLVLLALLGFVVMVVLMLPHLAPPTRGEDTKAPGNIIVEARWPDDLDADVDLWVKAPGDKAVGYSQQSGVTFDLLRDDLGFERDGTGLNYEFAFSRGAPAGGYVVNLHLYSSRAAGEIPVTVVVALARGGKPVKLFTGTRILRAVGQEITVLRFELDARGQVLPGSIGDMPFPIKTARQ